MNVLFYRYGSICEPDMLSTFMEFGFQVTEITEEVKNKNFTPEQGVNLVSRILMDQPHDFVFSINFYPFLAEVCNILKIRYLCWIVDSPVTELYAASIRHPWNRVFLFDRVLYEEIAPMNPAHIFYLPLAVNTEQKQAVIAAASEKEKMRFQSDITFVGSLYTEKCPFDQFRQDGGFLEGYLQGLIEAQLKVYGYYFIDAVLTEKIIQDFKENTPDFLSLPYADARTDRMLVSQYYIASRITALERQRMLSAVSKIFAVQLYTGSDTSLLPGLHTRGFAKTLTEMPLIFHQSRINLNMTAKSIRSALPLRIWDILGCGGFCMTNFQAEIPDYFAVGEEIETYSSQEELLEKCAYYLEHERRRAEIAQQGYEKVRNCHTYPIRVSRMMEQAFEI